jgi:hypothetical protein
MINTCRFRRINSGFAMLDLDIGFGLGCAEVIRDRKDLLYASIGKRTINFMALCVVTNKGLTPKTLRSLAFERVVP